MTIMDWLKRKQEEAQVKENIKVFTEEAEPWLPKCVQFDSDTIKLENGNEKVVIPCWGILASYEKHKYGKQFIYRRTVAASDITGYKGFDYFIILQSGLVKYIKVR